MTQLMSTLNDAYEVREGRSWLRVHLISLGLTVAMSIPIIAASLLVLAGGHVVEVIAAAVGLSYAGLVAGKILQWALALGFVVCAFAVIYYFAPDVRERHWYWITPGSPRAVIILMLWFYVTGLAFLIRGQVNSTIERAAAEHGHPEAKPAGKKAA